MKRLIFVTFLSAFLLFQIELIIAKILLPVFGGSYLVWGASVVFFQCALLLGYLYSHAVFRAFGMARYRPLHCVLILLPLLVFPGRGLPHPVQHAGVPLAADVFFQLALTIGPAFFALSTTSVVLQSLLAASGLEGKKNPYVLYAVSNLGSFAALFTYPFLFEAWLDTGIQLAAWRAGYLLFAAVSLAAMRIRVVSLTDPEEREEPAPAPRTQLRWLVLSAAGVAAFLSVTNIITCEIMPVPLFWIIPLGIYLLSFVLNFKKNPFCPAWIRKGIGYTIGLSVLLFFVARREVLPAMAELCGYLLSLSVICMFCQNSLAASRPGKAGLTRFYLIVALGGFLGGLAVSWVIPVIASSLAEFLLALALVSWSQTLEGEQAELRPEHARMLLYGGVILLAWPAVFSGFDAAGVILLVFPFLGVFRRMKGCPRAVFLSAAMFFLIALIGPSLWAPRRIIHSHRDYYSVYKISDDGGIRYMISGSTLHGAQLRDPAGARLPVIYYDGRTPAGGLLSSGLFPARTMGVVGLGTGSLSVYGREGQEIDFFELDPDVVRIARRYFTYLGDSPARVSVVTGDARISLASVPAGRYDLLVIDAFSGDSVPVHLLTLEALEEYRRRTAAGGIILFHVSNRYVDLLPVLFAGARSLNAYAAVGYNPANLRELRYETVWVALTWDEKAYGLLTGPLKWKGGRAVAVKKVRPWTDAYSSVLPVLKLSAFRLFPPRAAR